MVSALDEAVGNVTKALEDAGMLNDTIIIFTADVRKSHTVFMQTSNAAYVSLLK